MKLSVLQWNILYKEDIKDIAEFLKKTSADVICLQELIVKPDEDRPEILSQMLKYDYFFNPAQGLHGIRGRNYDIGNGVFSRYPILKEHFEYIKKPINEPQHASEEGRVYVEAEIAIGERRVRVGTTHLSYAAKFQENPDRKEEADNLAKILKPRAKNLVFTGDLNNLPDSYTIKSLSKILSNAGPPLNSKTFANKPYVNGDFKVDKLEYRIDYVFTSKDMKVIKSELLKPKVSDHLPILVTIEV